MCEATAPNAGASEQRQLVVFELAEETYGVDIDQVREIIRVPQVTKVPKTPGFVEGVINLRGGIIPVLNLRLRFGMTLPEDSDEARIVIVELGEQLVGIRVDAVSEVMRVDTNQIEPPPPNISDIDSRFVTGIARLDSRLAILLDLNVLLHRDEEEQFRQELF